MDGLQPTKSITTCVGRQTELCIGTHDSRLRSARKAAREYISLTSEDIAVTVETTDRQSRLVGEMPDVRPVLRAPGVAHYRR
jgi:hypothetical protein